MSDIFRNIKGNVNFFKYQVKLCQLNVFTKKNKLLIKTTDIVKFKRLVLCKNEITCSFETAIFHYTNEYANINHY